MSGDIRTRLAFSAVDVTPATSPAENSSSQEGVDSTCFETPPGVGTEAVPHLTADGLGVLPQGTTGLHFAPAHQETPENA
ncbi:hypothetical protein [Saccharothrix obliqua]|uniref:hypothetical protein n=1 Tax=Saccharothrix obliqua TaxID=2861747 RepID=UPI001C5D2CFB|nr:hypothetical protein [Saccharothrix obliqua]MBW4721595.1 hypothetical protein [Saccharothrix obliqua]